MAQMCLHLNAAEAAQLQADGYILRGGPYPNQIQCGAVCGSLSSSSGVSLSSSSASSPSKSLSSRSLTPSLSSAISSSKTGGTISTTCCPDVLLPANITATITGSGSCDGSYPMTFDLSLNAWITTGPIGECPTEDKPAISLTCGDGATNFAVAIDGTSTAGGVTTISCSNPFLVVASGINELHDFCGCASIGATITFTI